MVVGTISQQFKINLKIKVKVLWGHRLSELCIFPKWLTVRLWLYDLILLEHRLTEVSQIGAVTKRERHRRNCDRESVTDGAMTESERDTDRAVT